MPFPNDITPQLMSPLCQPCSLTPPFHPLRWEKRSTCVEYLLSPNRPYEVQVGVTTAYLRSQADTAVRDAAQAVPGYHIVLSEGHQWATNMPEGMYAKEGQPGAEHLRRENRNQCQRKEPRMTRMIMMHLTVCKMVIIRLSSVPQLSPGDRRESGAPPKLQGSSPRDEACITKPPLQEACCCP